MWAALALFAPGCYSPPKPLETYEYLDRYDRMSDRCEPVLSLVYVAPDAKFADYKAFVVGNVTVGQHWIENAETARRYATLFRNLFYLHLQKKNRFTYVVTDPEFKHTTPMLRLEAKVTIFDSGSAICRFLTPFYFFLQGAGASDFQLEGRIYDTSTDKVLMEFVDRRRFIGNTPWGPNPATLKEDFVMKQTVLATAEALAVFLDKACEGSLPDLSGEKTDSKAKQNGSRKQGR